MTKNEYHEIESYMLSQKLDSAHDEHHVYRVLYAALDIAVYEEKVDEDVLITACLLHDIGREQQFLDENVCHALAGGQMAYDYLISRNWPEAKAQHVKECVSTHRFRSAGPPQSIEAKILFDSDKLDVAGAMGIARTLIYQGQVDARLYRVDENGYIITKKNEKEDSTSFFEEFNYKLKNIYNTFYTKRAKEIAEKCRQNALDFYSGIHNEVIENFHNGKKHLKFD